jgi:hypothetical protein
MRYAIGTFVACLLGAVISAAVFSSEGAAKAFVALGVCSWIIAAVYTYQVYTSFIAYQTSLGMTKAKAIQKWHEMYPPGGGLRN